jgi:hypothetical protein
MRHWAVINFIRNHTQTTMAPDGSFSLQVHQLPLRRIVNYSPLVSKGPYKPNISQTSGLRIRQMLQTILR